jgi:hypothetical protein
MAGRQQEAIAPLEKAIRINPIAFFIYFVKGDVRAESA